MKENTAQQVTKKFIVYPTKLNQSKLTWKFFNQFSSPVDFLDDGFEAAHWRHLLGIFQISTYKRQHFLDRTTYSTLHLPSDDVDEMTQLPVIVYNAAFLTDVS